MNERSEELILVDQRDVEVGHASKSECHDGDGLLHRAFSVFVFNSNGQLLIQKRAAEKRLWPGFWCNSCCSHPRRGENILTAGRRRVREELGMSVDVSFLYKFEYHARYAEAGSEHELCWVYTGVTDAAPVINTTEIMDWRWIEPAELTAAIAAEPARYTPWLKMEWERLNAEFAERLPRAG